MAATVVSVVIFLCGVLVGRGVRAERGGPIADASLTAVPVAASQTNPAVPANTANSGSSAASGSSGTGEAPPPSSTAQPPAGTDPRTAAPPPTVDDLTYFNRLEKQKGPPEELKKPSTPPARPAPPRVAENAPRTETKAIAPPPPPKEVPATSSAEAAREGFSIQIAAVGERSDADTLAKGLSLKGYSAYVLAPATGAPAVFRVRVGKFNSRREAESVAAKLEKEEHFRPWITR